MNVRPKSPPPYGTSEKFNTHGVGEVIVQFHSGDMDSVPIRSLEVQLKDGTWVDMSTAFRLHHIISNNENTTFREPISEAERIRGWHW